MNCINFIFAIVAIAVSFSIVTFSGAVSNPQATQAKSDTLIYSANRLADAFELYNQKRFTP